MNWAQPAAYIAGAIAILGWFVASWLRLYEARRESRHATYTRILEPAAACLLHLREGRREDRAGWVARHQSSYGERMLALTAAVGSVDLLGKRKVSWAAGAVRTALLVGLQLDETEALDEQEDFERFVSTVRRAYAAGLEARDDFVFMAGRSLESVPVRWWRDRRSPARRDLVAQIEARTASAAARVDAVKRSRRRQAERGLVVTEEG